MESQTTNVNVPYISESEARALGYACADALTTTADPIAARRKGLVALIGGGDEFEGKNWSAEMLAKEIMYMLKVEFDAYGYSKKAWLKHAKECAEGSSVEMEDLLKDAALMYDLGCAMRRGLENDISKGVQRFAKELCE